MEQTAQEIVSVSPDSIPIINLREMDLASEEVLDSS